MGLDVLVAMLQTLDDSRLLSAAGPASQFGNITLRRSGKSIQCGSHAIGLAKTLHAPTDQDRSGLHWR